MTGYERELKQIEALLEGDEDAQAIALGIEPTRMTEWKPLHAPAAPPPFPVHVLPPIGCEMACAVAEAVQVSPDMCACFLLGALGAATLGKVTIEAKPGWQEPAQLYVVVGAAPSERKSPAMVPFFAPVEAWTKARNDERRLEIAKSQQHKKALESRLKKATEKSDTAEIDRLVEEIDAMQEAKPLEVLLTDATPEALARAMGRNNGAIAFKSAEGGLFNILAGAYSDLPNLDVLLQGYSGESIAVERVSRESVRIARAALSITLAVQPEPLEKFIANEAMLGRGLCARFLYSVPPSRIGERAFDCKPIPYSVEAIYAQRMTALMELPIGDEPARLTFDAMAQDALRQWHAEVEMKIAKGGEWNGILNGWEGKALGNTVRVAALLKLLDDPKLTAPITARHLLSAVEIMRYFIAQAIALGGSAQGLSSAARQVLEAILQRRESRLSPSALRQRLRKRKQFERGEAVDAALLELAAVGYLQLGDAPSVGDRGGRPPEAMWHVHPDLFKEGEGAGAYAEVIEI